MSDLGKVIAWLCFMVFWLAVHQFFYPWYYCWLDDLLAARRTKRDEMDRRRERRKICKAGKETSWVGQPPA